MKDLIVILITLTIIFGGNYFSCKYLEKSGGEVLSALEILKEGLDTHSDEEKEENIKTLNDVFDKNQRMWIMYQFHDGVNSMEGTMIECCNYYKTSNHEQFDISYEKLKRNIQDLKNREEISVLNIM